MAVQDLLVVKTIKMLSFKGFRCKEHAGMLLSVVLSAIVVAPAMAKTSPVSAAEALNAQQLRALSPAPTPNASPRSLTALMTPGGGAGSDVQTQQAISTDWMLMSGELVGQQLARWGQRAGWRVIWNNNQDWIVPGASVFKGDFTEATTQVLEDLATEGASVHGVFYQGNHTLVITGGSQ